MKRAFSNSLALWLVVLGIGLIFACAYQRKIIIKIALPCSIKLEPEKISLPIKRGESTVIGITITKNGPCERLQWKAEWNQKKEVKPWLILSKSEGVIRKGEPPLKIEATILTESLSEGEYSDEIKFSAPNCGNCPTVTSVFLKVKEEEEKEVEVKEVVKKEVPPPEFEVLVIVKESDTGKPISKATVIIDGEKRGETNPKGRLNVMLKQGKYSITVSLSDGTVFEAKEEPRKIEIKPEPEKKEIELRPK